MRHAHARRFDVPAVHVGQQARDLAGSGVSGSGRRLVRLPRVAISRAGPYECARAGPNAVQGRSRPRHFLDGGELMTVNYLTRL